MDICDCLGNHIPASWDVCWPSATVCWNDRGGSGTYGCIMVPILPYDAFACDPPIVQWVIFFNVALPVLKFYYSSLGRYLLKELRVCQRAGPYCLKGHANDLVIILIDFQWSVKFSADFSTKCKVWEGMCGELFSFLWICLYLFTESRNMAKYSCGYFVSTNLRWSGKLSSSLSRFCLAGGVRLKQAAFGSAFSPFEQRKDSSTRLVGLRPGFWRASLDSWHYFAQDFLLPLIWKEMDIFSGLLKKFPLLIHFA